MAVPKLEPCFTLRGYIAKEDTLSLNAIKSGPLRMITAITHGYFEGCGIKADILPGGADWVLMDPTTNAMHLDVRTQARTPDGYGFYIRYKGIIKLDEKAKSVIGGGPNVTSTQFGDHEWFTTPILETSHPDLKWVEESVFVAQGRFVVEQGMPNAMEYRICRVAT